MNQGLSDVLKKAFPSIVPTVRPSLVTAPEIIDPHWLTGFAAGECSFMIQIKSNKKFSLGFQVQLEFNLAQHKRDKQFIRSLIKYFECGHIYENQ